MKIKKILTLSFIGIVILILNGCAPRGPMQSKYGLMKTQWHDIIFLESIKKRNETVLYKGMTVMFKKERPSFALLQDELIITDKYIYLSEWNIQTLQYTIKLELSMDNIKSHKSTIVENSFFPNLEVLNIISKNNNKYNFSIFSKNVDYLVKIIDKNKL